MNLKLRLSFINSNLVYILVTPTTERRHTNVVYCYDIYTLKKMLHLDFQYFQEYLFFYFCIIAMKTNVTEGIRTDRTK